MKLKSTELAVHLQRGSWPSAILLYGPEQGQIRETEKRIRAQLFGVHAEDADFDAELFHGGDLNQERFYAACRTLPFVASRRLILVREAERVPAGLLPSIRSLLEHPNPVALLLFTATSLDAKSGLRLRFEADKSCWCVPYYPLEGRDFHRWLKERFAIAKLTVDEEALELLAQRLEGDTGAAHQELEKLQLYLGKDRHVVLKDVLAVVGETVDYTPFALAETVTAGEVTRALHILDRLLERGDEPLVLLGNLVARVRRLIQALELLAEGISPRQIATQLKIFWKDEGSFLNQARVIPPAHLAEVLLACQAADTGLKGVQKLDARQVMERTTMRAALLCGKK
ncbi:MAG: DNA polymerase III subunit delta [Magnetococcales bacterium]|nr:DNA polymerase III subunit delta [Magnetococcales bacterium]